MSRVTGHLSGFFIPSSECFACPGSSDQMTLLVDLLVLIILVLPPVLKGR